MNEQSLNLEVVLEKIWIGEDIRPCMASTIALAYEVKRLREENEKLKQDICKINAN